MFGFCIWVIGGDAPLPCFLCCYRSVFQTNNVELELWAICFENMNNLNIYQVLSVTKNHSVLCSSISYLRVTDELNDGKINISAGFFVGSFVHYE